MTHVTASEMRSAREIVDRTCPLTGSRVATILNDAPPLPGLKDALVFRGGVEVQVQRVSRKVDMHYVMYVNNDASVELRSLALYLDAFQSDRNIVFLGLLEDGSANIV